MTTETIRPRRSALYMPGSNARAMEKARSLPADVVILDLEDAVAPDAKETARTQVCDAVTAGGFGGREVVIRTNGLDTPWFSSDISAAAAAGPSAVLVPKVSTTAHVRRIEAALASAPASLKLWAMIETPLAILNLREIAAEADGAANPAKRGRLAVFVVGTNDLVKETRADLAAGRAPAMYWLQATVTAARAYGIDVLDGVYNNFRDAEGYRRECLEGRALGMDGKTLIHPDQIALANEIFAPKPDDVAWARKIIAAFEDPSATGKGVITLDGKMVELLHRDMALRTVAIADAIAGRA